MLLSLECAFQQQHSLCQRFLLAHLLTSRSLTSSRLLSAAQLVSISNATITIHSLSSPRFATGFQQTGQSMLQTQRKRTRQLDRVRVESIQFALPLHELSSASNCGIAGADPRNLLQPASAAGAGARGKARGRPPRQPRKQLKNRRRRIDDATRANMFAFPTEGDSQKSVVAKAVSEGVSRVSQ